MANYTGDGDPKFNSVSGNGSKLTFNPSNGTDTSYTGYTLVDKVNSFEEYTLPVATKNNLGGIKVGDGLSIDNNGLLSILNGSGSIWLTGTADPTSNSNEYDLYLNTTSGDVFQYLSNSWELKGNIKGPQGIQGIQGIQGNIGPKGETGSPGTGLNPKGSWVSGTTYNPGDYVFSSSGSINSSMFIAKGSSSFVSTIEPHSDTDNWIEFSAPQGEKGDTGPQGIQGIQGETGPKGDTGPSGKDGTSATISVGKVTTGDTANVVNSGTELAAILDFTLVNGKDGNTGQRGSIWSSGSGTPSNTAENNDFYLDKDNGDYYTFTNSWSLVGNIRGPQGIQGDTGSTGPKGDTGVGMENKGTWVSGTIYSRNNYVFYYTSSSNFTQSMYVYSGDSDYTSTLKPYSDTDNWVQFQPPTGTRGSTWTVINTDPTTSNPSNPLALDFVLNNSSWDIFQYINDTWTNIGNIKGPQGIQGEQGIQGVKGDTGAQGIQGTSYVNDGTVDLNVKSITSDNGLITSDGNGALTLSGKAVATQPWTSGGVCAACYLYRANCNRSSNILRCGNYEWSKYDR